MTIKTKAKASEIARFVASRKAEDIVVLDARKLNALYDYFVICSTKSTTQANALHLSVLKKFKKEKFFIHHYERDESLRWILIDFFDVVLHIFDEQARNYYNLEYLWHQAKKINFIEKRIVK